MAEITEPPVRVVIDNGSYMCKAGFAGDDAPRAIIPTLVGKSIDGKDPYVGDEARESKNGFIEPIQNGIIEDWDAMEKVWFHTFYNELRTSPDKQAVLLTEPPLNPKSNREKMTEIMFEKFDVPSMYVCMQSVLALYASGKTTGFVYDFGDGVSHTVPIYEGYPIPDGITRLDYSTGRNVTDLLKKELDARGYSVGWETVRDIKEKFGYVSLNYKDEMQKATPTSGNSYTLPDGNIINVGSEAFKCTEVLFNPLLESKSTSIASGSTSSAASEETSIFHRSIDGIMKFDFEFPRDMLSHVVLSGGTTLFPGFVERFQRDINQFIPSAFRIVMKSANVFAPAERKYSTWIGGSILSSLHTFREMWIKKDAYLENGARIVHQMCPQ